MLMNDHEVSAAEMEAVEAAMQEEDLSSLMKVGNFRLKNQGGFVVRMDFVYLQNNISTHRDGSRERITLGKTDKRDPGRYGVPPGAVCTIHADVVWGTGRTGTIWFIYEPGNSRTANFTISGTTLHNELGFNGIS